jgi:hypothetical protein
VKRTKKFLRMKALLARAMSSEVAYRYDQKLEDWRDCQALVACGFQVKGTTKQGTIFSVEGMDMAVQAGLPEYLRK